jgi:hypothetical protein
MIIIIAKYILHPTMQDIRDRLGSKEQSVQSDMEASSPE